MNVNPKMRAINSRKFSKDTTFLNVTRGVPSTCVSRWRCSGST